MKIAPLSVIRYPGPRFYDTVNAKHLSFDEIGEWRSRGISFQVRDAETGEDVTGFYYLNLAAWPSGVFGDDPAHGIFEV